MLSVVMLIVTYKPFVLSVVMLIVVMLSGVMLSVMAPKFQQTIYFALGTENVNRKQDACQRWQNTDFIVTENHINVTKKTDKWHVPH